MSTMKIGSLELKVPSPYSPGHTCTASEAAILNNEYRRRIRYNLLRRYGTDAVMASEMQAINRYIREYTISGHDTMETVSLIIALDLVKHQIKAQGKNLRDYKKSALTAEAKKVLEGPKAVEIRALAKRRIAFIEEASIEEMEKRHA